MTTLNTYRAYSTKVNTPSTKNKDFNMIDVGGVSTPSAVIAMASPNMVASTSFSYASLHPHDGVNKGKAKATEEETIIFTPDEEHMDAMRVSLPYTNVQGRTPDRKENTGIFYAPSDAGVTLDWSRRGPGTCTSSITEVDHHHHGLDYYSKYEEYMEPVMPAIPSQEELEAVYEHLRMQDRPSQDELARRYQLMMTTADPGTGYSHPSTSATTSCSMADLDSSNARKQVHFDDQNQVALGPTFRRCRHSGRIIPCRATQRATLRMSKSSTVALIMANEHTDSDFHHGDVAKDHCVYKQEDLHKGRGKNALDLSLATQTSCSDLYASFSSDMFANRRINESTAKDHHPEVKLIHVVTTSDESTNDKKERRRRRHGIIVQFLKRLFLPLQPQNTCTGWRNHDHKKCHRAEGSNIKKTFVMSVIEEPSGHMQMEESGDDDDDGQVSC